MSEYYGELNFPFKRYQIGKVYRGEKAQAGRYREFYQCDVDIIGDGELSIIHDAEIPSIIYTTFKELGFEKFTIHINNRKILNGIFDEIGSIDKTTDILRIIDKIEKIGAEKVQEELSGLGIAEKEIQTIMSFIEISGTNSEKIQTLKELGIKSEIFNTGLNELEQVINLIKVCGVPEKNFEIDLTIARGLDYYTGTVYETFLDDYKKLGSVCSGGRYENLAEYYTDKKLPGVGISIGLTRFFYQARKEGLIKSEKTSISKVLVLPMTNNLEKCMEVTSKLREAKINTEIYLEDKKIKAKFKYADKLKIPFAVVIGDDEIANNKVTLKNMTTGEQEALPIENVIEKLSL